MGKLREFFTTIDDGQWVLHRHAIRHPAANGYLYCPLAWRQARKGSAYTSNSLAEEYGISAGFSPYVTQVIMLAADYPSVSEGEPSVARMRRVLLRLVKQGGLRYEDPTPHDQELPIV